MIRYQSQYITEFWFVYGFVLKNTEKLLYNIQAVPGIYIIPIDHGEGIYL